MRHVPRTVCIVIRLFMKVHDSIYESSAFASRVMLNLSITNVQAQVERAGAAETIGLR